MNGHELRVLLLFQSRLMMTYSNSSREYDLVQSRVK